MVEMIADIVAGIVGLIKKGDYAKASTQIDDAYYNFLHEDAAALKNIAKEQLTTKLLQEHNFTHEHLEILAELFYAQAELLCAEGNTRDSVTYFEKTIILFDFVMQQSKTYSLSCQTKIKAIETRIAELKGTDR